MLVLTCEKAKLLENNNVNTRPLLQIKKKKTNNNVLNILNT